MKSKTRISKFFETLIYFILLTIPMISVFARVIYVQSNNHSYMSYSDVSNYRSIKLTESNKDLFISGKEYLFYGQSVDNVRGLLSQYSLIWSECSYDFTTEFNLSYVPTGFRFTNPVNTDTIINFLDDTGTIWSIDYYRTSSFMKSLTFEFTYVSSTYNAGYYINGWVDFTNIYLFAYMDGKLDNAFDYGLQKTIDDFGTGNINFLNWFGSMFSNNTNLLYINFVNMYLNYALWVSVGYLLYYFLNWFIRFVRETLDNLIYKETKN